MDTAGCATVPVQCISARPRVDVSGLSKVPNIHNFYPVLSGFHSFHPRHSIFTARKFRSDVGDMAAPPELKVLCRKLTSVPADDLPRLCPLLVSHVLRCGGPLSAPADTKAKDKSSETPMLVHKLRTHISTLLTGRSSSGRFAAVCLIKAVIDVGGWESLRASGPWIRGLIGLLQVRDTLFFFLFL